MSNISTKTVISDAPIEIVEHPLGALSLQGSTDPVIEMTLDDPLVARYSFNDTASPVENTHNSGVYDGVDNGTSVADGVVGEASVFLQLDPETKSDISLRNTSVSETGTVTVTDGAIVASGNVSNYLEYSADKLDLSSDFTIEQRVSASDFSTRTHIFDGTYRVTLLFGTGGTVDLYLSTNGSSWDVENATSVFTPEAGTEYHFAIVYNQGVLKIFVDGVLV